MLVLSRKETEDILITLKGLIPLIKDDPSRLTDILSEPIVVRNLQILGNKTRLGIEADRLVTVNRREVEERE